MNKGHERTVAFIVVRLSSSRFAAKQMRMLGDRPLLAWTLKHLQECRQIDEIVLATVAEKDNLPLLAFAEQHQIPCFWYAGEVNHVTARLCAAAQRFNAQICLLISGDCPLVDGPCIDDLIEQFRLHPEKDYLITPPQNNNFCMLQGVSIARKSAWLRADQLSSTPELKEHQFPALSLNPQLFTALHGILAQPYYSQYHRLSVDTWADYLFFKKVFSRLDADSKTFTLKNTIELLTIDPELKKINAHVHQRRLHEDIPVILCIAYASDIQNHNHLDSTLHIIEIGLHIIESKGWPIHYLTDSTNLQEDVEQRGIRCSLITGYANLTQYLHTLGPPFHLIIDNAAEQFTPDMISHLIYAPTSSIIIGRSSTSFPEEKVLALTPVPTAETAARSAIEYSQIIVDFIERRTKDADSKPQSRTTC